MSDSSRTLGPQERLLLLRKLTLADGVPAAALVPLAEYAEERFWRRGSVVVDDGQELPGLLVVVNGTVQRSKGGRLLRPVNEAVIGALEVLAGRPSTSRVTATSDLLVLELPAVTLFDVFEDHFAMFLGTLRGLAVALVAAGPALTTIETPPLPPGSAVNVDDCVDRVEMLRAHPIFTHSRLESLIRFAARLEPFRADPGERLWQCGEPASWMLFLAEGDIRCRMPDGSQFTQRPGAYVGAIEPFAALPRWFDATAGTALVGLRISIERFVDVLEDDFSLARDVLREFAGGLLVLQEASDAAPLPDGRR